MMRTSGRRCAAIGKAEPGVHPGRVAFDRCVDELGHAGEFDDLVEPLGDLRPPHAHDRALEQDVLAAREIGVESGGDFDQRADPSLDGRQAGRRLEDPRQDLERGGLAGAVGADDAERLARRHLERDVAERPELLGAEQLVRARPRRGRARVTAPGRAGCRDVRRDGISWRRCQKRPLAPRSVHLVSGNLGHHF